MFAGYFLGLLALLVGVVGVQLDPDTSLFLDGFAVYPSPLGTLIGSVFGFYGLAVVNALAVGALGFLVSDAPGWSLVASLPVVWWALPVGVDSLAALLVVVGFLAWESRSRWADALVVLAGGVHVAALSFLVAIGRRWIALALGGALVALMFGTPYGDAFPGEEGLQAMPLALGAALIVTSLGLAPALLGGVPPSRSGGVALMAVATFALALYAVQADLVHRNASFGLALFAATRYALPLTLIALVLSAERRAERPTTAPGKGIPMRRFKAFGFSLVVAVTAALVLVPLAAAQTVPAIPVDEYGDSLLSSLATAIGAIFPYAAAITAFAIGVGMVKRWLGHRKATRV